MDFANMKLFRENSGNNFMFTSWIVKNYNPLKSTSSNTSEGMRQEEFNRGSLPVSMSEFQSEIMLPVIFISFTG
jgi:hypothetical protein